MRGALSARICVLERGRNQDVAVQLERVGRRRDVRGAGKVQDRAGLAPVATTTASRSRPVGVGDRAFVLGQADQDRAALLAELRDVVADVAQALHDDALAGEARRQARARACRRRCAHASRSAKNSPRPVASRRPRMPPWLTGLPVTHAERVELVGRHRLVGVDDPRHLALARAVVRRRHVHAGTDEVLLDQLVRVAPRDAFELFERQLARDRSARRPWRRRTARRRSRTCRSSAPPAPSPPPRRRAAL